MKIPTKIRYGLRFLLDVAEHGDQGVVTLREASLRQGISQKYLWQVVAPLKSAGLITSERGKDGGFRLAREPGDVTIRDVYTAIEGGCALVGCLSRPATCPRHEHCEVRDVWDEISQGLGKLMQEFTLEQILERESKRRTAQGPDYSI
ncbi:Rrf2 family transcriptional regulator [Desulfonatronum sp. SC1]|uniref:RrF2 family transcriptional regulator n=1 Tax=Desulfonatronum sp. SC1 TaxID=2109626 RepID=UPI000D31502E|nr:Rrf2 family transcriptional regulator [Desulfonatronum sp. SC1]PTN33935.1 AsnC family transcriptional regulator [Desulfonatronum sp. SC1]